MGKGSRQISMKEKIVAIYYNGYLANSYGGYNHGIQNGIYVLYEISYKSIWHFMKFVTKRDFRVYGAPIDLELGYQYKTDTYQLLVKPWLDGIDIDYLEQGLKDSRRKIDPNNTFIYKKYDPKESIPTT